MRRKTRTARRPFEQEAYNTIFVEYVTGKRVWFADDKLWYIVVEVMLEDMGEGPYMYITWSESPTQDPAPIVI